MHVNESFANLTITFLEVELADRTTRSVVFDALRSCLRIALVTVYQNAMGCSFQAGFTVGYLA